MSQRKTSMLEGFRAQFSTKVLVLIPIAAGINLVGGALCSSLKLPLFLDMIGTMVIACLSGPWVAALTGLLTNVFLAIVANPVYLPYAVVSVLCGFVVGVMARIGLFCITVFVYGGATGVTGTSLFTASLVVALKDIAASVFSSSLITNFIDKGIAVFVAYVVVSKIPRRFLSQYAADSADAQDDDNDGGDDDDVRR